MAYTPPRRFPHMTLQNMPDLLISTWGSKDVVEAA